MKKMLEGSRVTAFDRRNIESGRHDGDALIAGAARAMHSLTAGEYRGKRTLIIIGGGNNGADGLALALILSAIGETVALLFRGEGKTPGNIWRRGKCAELGIPVTKDPHGFDVIVDALYGASYHPPLGEDDRAFIDMVNDIDAVKITCDVPSAYRFRADITVCFTFPKTEMYDPRVRMNSGRILFGEPGFTEEEKAEEHSDILLLSYDDLSIPEMPMDGYKNTRGHLLIEGGSECFSGASRLAAKSAFRTGAGLVTIKTGKDAYLPVSQYTSAIVTSEPVEYSKYSAAVFGPGWGRNSSRAFTGFMKNMVIDASALDEIEKGDRFSFRAVLTPHMGEWRRLKERLSLDDDIRKAAAELEAVIVLKGADTFMTDGKTLYVLDEMNPSLGVAGSGDVLSGAIGALLASGMAPLDAALNGVLLHSLAGKKAHIRHGYYDSEELIDEMGGAR